MEPLNVTVAVLNTVAAGFVAYVAYQQYQFTERLGERQFRHELYDRRFKVFQAARSFLSDVAATASARPRRCVQFRVETAEAEFLFRDDIVKLLDGLYSQGLKLAMLHEQLYPESGERGLPKGDTRSEVAEDEQRVLRETMDTLTKLKDAFKPYLAVH